MTTNTKAKLLSTPVEHFDITKIDARPIIEAMGKMSFTARDLGRGYFDLGGLYIRRRMYGCLP